MALSQTIAALTPDALNLCAGSLSLRPFAAADAPILAKLANDVRIARTTARLPYPYTLADAETWIAGHAQAQARGESLSWAWHPHGAGHLVGAVGLEVHGQDSVGVLGYWVGVDFWGRGYATCAAQVVTRFAFGVGVQKMAADCLAHNAASLAVLRRCGYVQEGLRRQHAYRDNRRHDVVEFGLLAPVS